MSGRQPRVYWQGASSAYVIGTDQSTEAAKCLPPEVAHWWGSFPGAFARRQGRWRDVDREPPFTTPKDARPGVLFTGCTDADGRPVRGVS